MNQIFLKIIYKPIHIASVFYTNTIYSCLLLFNWLSPRWLTWNNYSESMLRTLEKKILQILKTPHRGFFVDIGPLVGKADKIWTISLNTEAEKTPLVLLHGLGAGSALWCLNLDAFASTRPVYAMDLLGFGRSSRPDFSNDGMEAEQEMIRSIEEWRKEMKLKEFIILGHSLGGFLAASYAISYPRRVKHLILADPWGFPEHTSNYNEVPLWIRTLSYMMKPFNPLAGIRAAGPFGPWLINTVRPDIPKKYQAALDDPNLIPDYIYQCNCQHPSGESAFRTMMAHSGWAKHPMVRRIDKLDSDIPVTLLYGSRSWLDHSASDIMKEKRIHSYIKVQVINGAGHHIYADKPEAFNQAVLESCGNVENLPVTATQKSLPSPESDEPESDR